MRVLLSEDEQELSKAICAVLKHNGYSVDAVYNGVDACEYAGNGNYDAMILDLMMPKMDGISVLRKIRASGNKVPIIILTAKTSLEYKLVGLDSGADDYMTKPFEMKELLARIRAVTRRQVSADDNTLSFSDITLDRATCVMSCGHEDVKLVNKEYQIMEMLMSSPQKIISTENFMDKIWGFESESEINVVWVYISYIRRKLKQIGAHVAIKASRNLGYSLEEVDDEGNPVQKHDVDKKADFDAGVNGEDILSEVMPDDTKNED